MTSTITNNNNTTTNNNNNTNDNNNNNNNNNTNINCPLTCARARKYIGKLQIVLIYVVTPSGGTCTTPNYYSNGYYRWLSPASLTRGQPGLDTPDIITVTPIAKYWINDTRHSDI